MGGGYDFVFRVNIGVFNTGHKVQVFKASLLNFFSSHNICRDCFLKVEQVSQENVE